MSESVIADFLGSFHAPSTPSATPVRGRIICSSRRLVLAMDSDSSVQIPLTAVVDIGVGTVPPDLEEFFDSTVTIAFERDGQKRVAAIEADTQNIRKFATVLFGAILEGSEVSIRHPTAFDGRLTDQSFRSATIGIERTAVTFGVRGETAELDLGAVIGFDRATAEIDGTDRLVIEIVSSLDDRIVTTHIGVATSRHLSLLGRYLRIEYSEAAADIRDLDLDLPAKRVLLVNFAAAGDSAVDDAGTTERDTGKIRASLAETGLLTEACAGAKLTHRGRIAVQQAVTDVGYAG